MMRGAESLCADDGELTECKAMVALRQVLAILRAIEFGELLSALPDDPADRVRHQTGVDMLELMETRLRSALRGPVPLSECLHRVSRDD